MRDDIRTDLGYIVDRSSGDGGDTLNREGQYAVLTGKFNKGPISLKIGGQFVRNPNQVPWNNPKNVSRDQLTPIICALHIDNQGGMMGGLFTWELRGKFFAPNTERDYPGSTKYPYPHTFINDRGVKETRNFDSPDIMSTPLSYLIATMNGEKKPIYKALAWTSLLLSVFYKCVVTTRLNPDRADDWQMLCLCLAIDPRLVRLYKKLHSKGYEYSIKAYWLGWRNEPGFADLWRKKLESI